jgi:Uri superfamily endonuclease
LVQIKAMFDLHDVPSSQGTYVLHFYISHSQAIVVGRLGQHHFPAGHYFYVGSARGAGGLRARVGRHLRGDGARHWHIDYLRAVAEVRRVLYTVTDSPLECAWSQALAQLPGAFIPVPHFGATDCRSGCEAHLIGFPRHADVTDVPRALAAITPTPIVSLRPR